MMEPEPTLPFGDAEDTVAWLLDRAQMFDPYIQRPMFEQLARWIEHAAADTLRMTGWQPPSAVGDWCIDTSTPSPILTYQKCSVIQGEQASYVMHLIAKDQHVPPNTGGNPRERSAAK